MIFLPATLSPPSATATLEEPDNSTGCSCVTLSSRLTNPISFLSNSLVHLLKNAPPGQASAFEKNTRD